MCDLITDEQEVVKLEAFAVLAQVLEFIPKAAVANSQLIKVLSTEFRHADNKLSVDLQELMVTQSVQILH